MPRFRVISKKLETFEKAPEEKRLFDIVSQKRADYTSGRKGILDIKLKGDAVLAAKMIKENMLPALDAYVDSINAVLDYEKEAINKSSHRH